MLLIAATRATQPLPEDSQAKKIMAEYGALLDQFAVMAAIGKAAEIAALVSARNEAITAEVLF